MFRSLDAGTDGSQLSKKDLFRLPCLPREVFATSLG
jgi:hypothetical protein